MVSAFVVAQATRWNSAYAAYAWSGKQVLGNANAQKSINMRHTPHET